MPETDINLKAALSNVEQQSSTTPPTETPTESETTEKGMTSLSAEEVTALKSLIEELKQAPAPNQNEQPQQANTPVDTPAQIAELDDTDFTAFSREMKENKLFNELPPQDVENLFNQSEEDTNLLITNKLISIRNAKAVTKAIMEKRLEQYQQTRAAIGSEMQARSDAKRGYVARVYGEYGRELETAFIATMQDVGISREMLDMMPHDQYVKSFETYRQACNIEPPKGIQEYVNFTQNKPSAKKERDEAQSIKTAETLGLFKVN